jgi:Zn-dependent protease with chaperone function
VPAEYAAPAAPVQCGMDDGARYHRLQFRLGVARLALTVGFLLAVLTTGAAGALARTTAGITRNAAAQVGLVTAALAVAHALLLFPLGWLSGFSLPRRFGLLHQPFRAWLADRAKASAIGAVLGLGGVEVVYALLRATSWWWLAAAAVFFVVYVVMATVLPVWVLPMFYRLTPLADEALTTRLTALAARAGIRAVGVWIADQSRKSRTANAALVGLGRTRRIVLYDTLTARFTPDEIESVLAHELGHHVHGDLRRGLLVQGALTLVTFRVADVLLRVGVDAWGLRGIADPAGLPWFGLVLVALGLVSLPLGNAFSRLIERQADDFALATTGNPNAFVSAMERLASLNLAERRPHRLKEILLYSHPALDRRIARARR